MTFSVAGYCVKTRMLGAALATSSIAVGARCSFALARTGVALIQNYADPSLGPVAIQALKDGKSAQETLDYLVETARGIAWRQIMIVDQRGDTAHYSGLKNGTPYRAAKGSHCVAAGNLLGRPGVPEACVTAFEANYESPLGERLLSALEAGFEAGSEMNPLSSAALLVVHREDWPLIDLRVDNHRAPIVELRKAWVAFEPEAMGFVYRALDPDTAPLHGSGRAEA